LVKANGITKGVIVDYIELQTVLTQLGERLPPASRLTLIGGSALILLGSPRLTVDIDFVGDDVNPNELHRQIIQIARELKIQIEPVLSDASFPCQKEAKIEPFPLPSLEI
jgi:hypothetical protein